MRAPLALLLLTACGGGPLVVEIPPSPDLPAWAPASADRARAAAVAAAGVWAGLPAPDAQALDGYTLEVLPPPDFDCGGQMAKGCTHDDLIRVSTPPYRPCIEATSIAHEVGHAILNGDPDHKDPRWHDPAFTRSVFEAIKPGIPPNDVACQEYVSIVIQYPVDIINF